MIKYITAAMIAATPVYAGEIQKVPITAYCTNDFALLQDAYGGGLELEGDVRVNGGGIGFATMKNKSHVVGLIMIPSGVVCVVWDSAIKGEPA